jgi:hypothetical protein
LVQNYPPMPQISEKRLVYFYHLEPDSSGFLFVRRFSSVAQNPVIARALSHV